MLDNNKNMKKQGFSLVELIIAISAFALLAAGVFSSIIGNYKGFYGIGDKQAVAEFAQEGIEAVRAIRDRSWEEIEDNITRNVGLVNLNNSWQFYGLNNVSGALSRVISISNVSRDGSGNIVDSGGTEDPDTKLVKVVVSGSGMVDYILQEFLTNWDFNVWDNLNWDGGAGEQFFVDPGVYGAGEYISDTKPGEITLKEASHSDWSDLKSIAKIDLKGIGGDIAFSGDDQTAYVIDNGTQDLRTYDISNARNGVIKVIKNIAINTTAYSIVLHPKLNYAYLGHASLKGENAISIIDLSSSKIVGVINFNSGIEIYDLVIGDINKKIYLYVLSNTGYVYVYNIDNPTRLINTNGGQFFSKGAINNGYFDGSKDVLYIVTSDISKNKKFIKINSEDPTKLKEVYNFIGKSNFIDIAFLSSYGDDLMFLIATENKKSEFQVIKDDSKSLFLKNSLDLNDISFKSVIYDGDKIALIYDEKGNIYSIDVSDISNLKLGPVKDTSSFGDLSKYPYNSMHYNSTLGGIFILENISSRRGEFSTMHFILRPQNIGIGLHSSSGSLTSSIFDLGSSKKELHTITTTQIIPPDKDCSIRITLETDDNHKFSSPSAEVYTLTGTEYTSIIDDSLHGKRWVRYTVVMKSCKDLTETPTLNSLKLKYE